MSRDGTRLYIANEDKGTASVLEVAGGKTLAEFEVVASPKALPRARMVDSSTSPPRKTVRSQ